MRAAGILALTWAAGASAQTVALYSHADAASVSRFVAAYSVGREPVLLDRGVPAGARWREVIADRIRDAQTVLLFWSASAAVSVEVGAEWRMAAALCRAPCVLVPVLLDDTPAPVDRQAVDWR